jgi:hypothetical protein
MTTEFNPHGFNHSFPRVYEAEQGKYVEYEDYAILKAEVERLIKAGDLLGSALILFELKSEEERQERLENWAIAKYGKLHD